MRWRSSITDSADDQSGALWRCRREAERSRGGQSVLTCTGVENGIQASEQMLPTTKVFLDLATQNLCSPSVLSPRPASVPSVLPPPPTCRAPVHVVHLTQKGRQLHGGKNVTYLSLPYAQAGRTAGVHQSVPSVRTVSECEEDTMRLLRALRRQLFIPKLKGTF